MASQPKPPSAQDTANAQTGANVSSSWMSSIMGNPNESTPYGTVNYKVSGYEQVTDPSSGKTYSVPRYERTTTLSPEQQNLLNKQNATASNLGDLATQQSKALQGILGTPLNTQGLQDWQAMPNWDANAFSADRQNVVNAMMGQYHQQADPQFAQREAQLAARGASAGTPLGNQAAQEQGWQNNDAIMKAILAGGQEQSRLLGEQRNQYGFNNNLRGQQFGERQTLQSFPVNLITALMSGSQVNVPQAAGYQSTPVQSTPIGSYMYDQYNANAQRAANTNNGIFGLAGSVLGLPLGGGGSLGGSLFSRMFKV